MRSEASTLNSCTGTSTIKRACSVWLCQSVYTGSFDYYESWQTRTFRLGTKRCKWLGSFARDAVLYICFTQCARTERRGKRGSGAKKVGWKNENAKFFSGHASRKTSGVRSRESVRKGAVIVLRIVIPVLIFRELATPSGFPILRRGSF